MLCYPGEKVKHKAEGVILHQKVNSLLSQAPWPWVLSIVVLRLIFRKVELFSLILTEWLLLHLSALVDGNLLLNWQSESINILSISIYSCITIILLSLHVYLYVAMMSLFRLHSMTMNKTAPSFLLYDQLSILLIILVIFFCSFSDF